MPSSNKTLNYNLNQWVSTDKPMMSDFNADNQILDTLINSHVSNTSLHLTSTEKQKISSPYTINLVAGDGTESKEITFSFKPSLVVYCLRGTAFTMFNSDNNYNIINGGIAVGNYLGASAGMELEEAKLTVHQTQAVTTGENFVNLNALGKQYLCVAFR